MLVFVIPLKSRAASRSWSTVSALFERTLKSVCRQTASNFKDVVVCHEKQAIEFAHENVEYSVVAFPLPDIIGDPTEDRLRKETDHAKKLWVGSVYAESIAPTHVMHVDADDCISRNLAAYVNENSQHNGWYVDKGFEYQDSGKTIYPKSKFYTKCGTSNIVRYDLIKPLFSTPLDRVSARDDSAFFMRHKLQRGYFDSIGSPLSPLPFPGAVYITGHGDNNYLEYFANKKKTLLDLGRLYGGKFRKRMVARQVTEELQVEFGL